MLNLQLNFIIEEVIKSIRNFFYRQKFHEVIVPILNDRVPLEPNLYPFVTTWDTLQQSKKYYLPMSPEKGLKMMLAKGIGNCFAISPSFRNLENSGPLHSPEFLMLEWYRENSDYEVIMNDVKQLFKSTYQNIESKLQKPLNIFTGNPWEHISIADLFYSKTDISFEQFVTDDSTIIAYANSKGYQTKGANWNELYDQIFVSEIEPDIPKDPIFLTDFPSRISPLCKPKKDKPYLAERFELYIGRIEFGNGNTENTDYLSVKKVFEKEKKKRIKEGLLVPPMDNQFLQSLKKMRNKNYAGVGIGIDRLLMLFTNISELPSLRTL